MGECKTQEIDEQTCLLLFRGDERTDNVRSLGTTCRGEMLLAHCDHTDRVVSIELIDPIQKKCQHEAVPEEEWVSRMNKEDLFDKKGRIVGVR